MNWLSSLKSFSFLFQATGAWKTILVRSTGFCENM